MYALLRNRKKIEALRAFTLESGHEEIERRNRRRKERGDADNAGSLRSSVDSIRSQGASQPQSPALSDHEDSGAFAIGDDEDESDEETRPTPAPSTTSENASQASSAVDFSNAVPTQLRGMSEKARGKMPAGMPTFSRQNSTTSLEGGRSATPSQAGNGFEASPDWLESWLPELPLHTILTTIQQLTAVLPRQALTGENPTPDALRRLQEVVPLGIEAPPPRVHTFEWSPLALGWYESLLWGFVFSSEVQPGKGAVGVWNGTGVKLFRVQGVGKVGPSLTSPRGAVDAVGRNVVERIGSGLRQGTGTGTGQGQGQGMGQQQQQQQ